MNTRILLLALCIGLALPAAAQDAVRGKALFESNCMRCHRDGATSLKTAPADLPALLADKSVRAHRFTLTEAEVQDIVACLAATRAPQ
ncbi:MAG: cytochrome c [Thiobacillus sp.]|uniref:c-type cytochrome n=1 Tax=Thiobacillus sp. TaxID=924 RepID=UPI002736765D|nr:cytochrome c [Thiobacillus sp.]MDP3583830.1 cytochrome c [Thiobacillus sp.]